MTLPTTVVSNGQAIKRANGLWPVSMAKADALLAIEPQQSFPLWANRLVLLGLAIFVLAVPHSIFGAHFGLNLSLLAWLLRDAALKKFHFKQTPLDNPLLWFAGLTVLSAIFSVEPAVSVPKLKTLLLFGSVYLLTTNLRPNAVRCLLALLLLSSLAGVGFSLFEKLYGRGLVIQAINPDSPLKPDSATNTKLQPGDVIWMIAKHRVSSLNAVTTIIRQQPDGKQLAIEALRAGDPLPMTLTVTPELKTQENPLGIVPAGRTRRFRVSGFTRQFLTYAEQLQMLALVSYGLLLAAFKSNSTHKLRLLCFLYGGLFLLYTVTLVFTASRAVIAALMVTVVILSTLAGGRRLALAALLFTLVVGSLSIFVITAARQSSIASFNDDSSARRLAYMQAGLRLIPRHPMLGIGMDSHKLHWQEWGFPGEYVTHTHSTLIQLALDRGLPALACYLWLIATMASIAWRNYQRLQNLALPFEAGIAIGTFGALIGFSVSSITNYNFGDAEVLLLLLLLLSLTFLANSSRLAQPVSIKS